MLRRLGVDNVERQPGALPKLGVRQVPEVDLAVLPDEMYLFTETDGPESFPDKRCALVSSRSLTWCGPATIEAPQSLFGVTAWRADLIRSRVFVQPS